MKLVKPAALFQQVLKRGATKQGRLLGLDVGSKYVGLALSDEHNKIAIPLRYIDYLVIYIFITVQYCVWCHLGFWIPLVCGFDDS
jgi:hypothetical protein